MLPNMKYPEDLKFSEMKHLRSSVNFAIARIFLIKNDPQQSEFFTIYEHTNVYNVASGKTENLILAGKKKPKVQSNIIARNKKAKFDYHLYDRFEAGVALEGWEVKSLRAGKCQLGDTYILLKSGEAFLLGCNITPMSSAVAHVETDPKRTRKLLLHRREIARLIGATQQKGQTCIPVTLYWKSNKVKCEIALALGKKDHDKRATLKDRDWSRDKSRIMKENQT